MVKRAASLRECCSRGGSSESLKEPQVPNTMAGVVYQPGAFSIVADGQINLAPDETAIKAAKDALNGWDPQMAAYFTITPQKQQINGCFRSPLCCE